MTPARQAMTVRDHLDNISGRCVGAREDCICCKDVVGSRYTANQFAKRPVYDPVAELKKLERYQG
jgi:hypothetical protein